MRSKNFTEKEKIAVRDNALYEIKLALMYYLDENYGLSEDDETLIKEFTRYLKTNGKRRNTLTLGMMKVCLMLDKDMRWLAESIKEMEKKVIR